MGLNNPEFLFDLIDCINDIRKKIKVVIEKNEIKSNRVCHQSSLSSETVNKLDELHQKCSFTIQFTTENVLAINQCIKISPSLLIEFINDDEVNEKLFCLAAHYLECFQIAPICCKMETMKQKTLVGYWQTYSNFYLQHFQSAFIKIAKLLYPYISSLTDGDLLREYLEIVPVRFIELKKPINLLNLLQKLYRKNISINILRSGRIIRLGNFYDIHHSALLEIYSVDSFASALNNFLILQNKFTFYRIGDLSVDEGGVYMEPVDYRHTEIPVNDEEELLIYLPKRVTYFPRCSHCKWELYESSMIIVDSLPLAMIDKSFKGCWNNSETRHILQKALKLLNQSFNSFNDAFILFTDYFQRLTFTERNEYRLGKNDSDNILINERIFLKRDEWILNPYQKIVNYFTKWQYENGLCFWYFKGDILFAPLYSYDNNDGFKRSMICKSDIIKAFIIFQSMLSINDSFEIAKDGSILFIEKFKFQPCILLAIENQRSFIGTIIKLSRTSADPVFEKMCKSLVSIGTEQTDTFAKEEYKESKEFWDSRKVLQPIFIEIARMLNSALKNLPDEYFLFKCFHSIPNVLFYEESVENVKKAHKILKELQRYGIHASLLDNALVVEHCCSFEAHAIFNLTNIPKMNKLYELLTEIDVECGLYIVFSSFNRVSADISIEEWDNAMEKTCRRPTNDAIKDELEKCAKIIEAFPQGTTKISIVENGILLIQTYITMLPSTFLLIKDGYRVKLLEAIKQHISIFENIYKGYNCWENWKNEAENLFSQHGGYSIVGNKAKIYLKIIKLLQPNLVFIKADLLASFNNLNIVTQSMIIKKPKKLMKRLLQLQENQCQFSISYVGTLISDNLELSVSQLISINDCKKLSNINKYLFKISEEKAARLSENSKKFFINSNGFFQSMYNIKGFEGAGYLINKSCVKLYKRRLAAVVNAVEHTLKISKLNLLITLNSDGAIMIGNFVWAYSESFLMTAKNFDCAITRLNTFVNLFSECDIESLKAACTSLLMPQVLQSNSRKMEKILLDFKHGRVHLNGMYKFVEIEEKLLENFMNIENLLQPLVKEMKSINGLQHIKKAIKLARIINPSMEFFPDRVIKSKYFRAFPTKLWNAWKTDSDGTFNKVKDIFFNLNASGLKWLLKLNGHIEIDRTIVITMDHLLKLQDFKTILSLIQLIKNESGEQLICEEDGKHDNLEFYKTTNINIDNTKIMEAKEIAQNLKKDQNSIASNGALLFNQNIWLKPETFLKNPNHIQLISENVVATFGESNFFMFGKWNETIIPSTPKNFTEELYEYCKNFCDVVKQQLPTAKIEYIRDRELFAFNDCIFISSMAFFNSKNIHSFVEGLKNYSDSTKSDEEREKTFIDDYFAKNSTLSKTANDERLEFTYVREYLLMKIRQIFLNNISIVEKFWPSIDVAKLNNLENLKIKDQYIFKEGVLKHINGELDVKEEVFLLALKMAKELNEKFKCRNLFDFSSVVEVINEYCRGKNVINKKVVKQTSKVAKDLLKNDKEYEILFKMVHEQLHLIEAQQQSNWKYIFTNELKGLHHWIKHGEICNSLHHYYEQMNTFFENPGKFKLQVITQNGLKFMRRYEKDCYVGVTVIPRKDAKIQYVATFYYDGKKYLKLDPKNLTKYLVFTDISFAKYDAEAISNNIMIDDLSKSKKIFVDIEKKLTRQEYANSNVVLHVLIMLSESHQSDALFDPFEKKWNNQRPKSKFNQAVKFTVKTINNNSSTNFKQIFDTIFK